MKSADTISFYCTVQYGIRCGVCIVRAVLYRNVGGKKSCKVDYPHENVLSTYVVTILIK